MGIKELFLNKGWAGKTLSRQETIERFNPIIRRHYELNHAYDYVINRIDDLQAAAQLNALQKTARADVGKLSETVLSAGGVSYNGTDLEPGDVQLGSDEADMVRELKEREDRFSTLVAEELGLEHQIRSRAILSVVLGNSKARLDYLRGLTKRHPRSSQAT